MAKEKISRKELLKTEDEFITTTAKVWRYLNTYSKQIAGGVAAVLVLWLAYWGWSVYQKNNEMDAQELQAKAYKTYQEAMSQTEPENQKELLNKAVEQFTEITDGYDGTQGGWTAVIYRGHTYYALGQYDEALEDYSAALKKASRDTTKALSLQGLGASYMAKGDYAKAIEFYEKLKKQGGTGFQRTAKWSIAKAYEKLGEKEKALAIYKELETEFTDMVHKSLTENKISKLSQ